MIPVLENASGTTKNASIDTGEYASLCTDLIPLELLAAKRYPAAPQLA